MKEIHINYIMHHGEKIHLKERITLVPYRSEHDELWLADYEPLGIDVFAYTKQLLKDFVYEELSFNYEYFALEEDKKLAYPSATNLKYSILEHIK